MCFEGLIDKFPQVDTCCCCCKVETGSKVIAWLGTIGSFLYTVALIMLIVAGAATVSQNKGTDASNHVEVIIVTLVVLLIYVVFFWVMALLLLIGLYKDDLGKVKVWLRVNVCLFVYGFVAQCLNIISSISTKQPAGNIVQGIISAIISVLVSIYMISVVKSHYYNRSQGFRTGA